MRRDVVESRREELSRRYFRVRRSGGRGGLLQHGKSLRSEIPDPKDIVLNEEAEAFDVEWVTRLFRALRHPMTKSTS